MPAGTSYTFKEGMLSPEMKRKQLMNGEECFELEVKNQFLHAVHPLGWIKQIVLQIDQTLVNEKDIYFVLREQWFAAETLHTITEVYWHLSESARICFKTAGLANGAHYVKCTFKLSMLEDPQILDMKNLWPLRIEYVDGEVRLGRDDI